MARPSTKKTGVTSSILKIVGGLRMPSFWSLSRYNDYAECPARYALRHVGKLCMICGSATGFNCGCAKPSIPAIERGIMVHKQGESYLKGLTKGLPTAYDKFEFEMRNLKKLGVKPEQDWTITVKNEPCEATDWDRAWLRTKLDAHHFYEDGDGDLLQVDFKTGQMKPMENQAEIMAFMSPFFYPKVNLIHVEFWFLDHGEVKDHEYPKKELPKLEKKWRDRASKMLGDRVFAARPGAHCNRCPFRSSLAVRQTGKPGPCTAWKNG